MTFKEYKTSIDQWIDNNIGDDSAYIAVSGDDMRTVSIIVSYLMVIGIDGFMWKPHGSLVNAGRYFYQPMIRERF